MYILHRRIYASNDILIKMWLVAALVIGIVVGCLMWNDRFRENVDTSIARISPFGLEVCGRESANFTGSRGFFNKMNKLGLPPSSRRTELATLFEEIGTAEQGGYSVGVGKKYADAPVLWVYAEGLTKADRDRCVQTYGKVFFDKSRFCFSIVAKNGFSVQLDPESFHVLWAKDGGAVCAVPLLVLPEDVAKNGFLFRVEERDLEGTWKTCGDIAFPRFEPPVIDWFAEDAAEAEGVKDSEDEADIVEPPLEEVLPQSVSIERFSVPEFCRFFSAPLWERAAFGELCVKMVGNASGKVPATAWSLENFGLYSDDCSQVFPMARSDAFHSNVRFLESDIFDDNSDGVLRVPVAKTLYPTLRKEGEDSSDKPWHLQLRFVRDVYFPEDYYVAEPLRVAKSDAVIGETVSAKNSTVKVRAFRDPNYVRLLNNKVPAVVLEIQQSPCMDADFFWTPYRVKTSDGEELFPESVVNVRPGIRQYWFMPQRSVPTKLEVIYAVTRYLYIDGTVVPAVRTEAL